MSVAVKAVGRSGGVIVPRAMTEWEGLDPYDFRLAVWLSTHTEEYERGHSQAGMARRLNMSQERVQKSLDVLKAHGLVSVTVEGMRGAKQITFHREAWEGCSPLATREGCSPLATREVTSRHTGGDLPPHGTLENTSRNTRSNTTRLTVDNAFVSFWASYPRREGKKAALAAFERAVRWLATQERLPTLDACKIIIDGAKRYAKGISTNHIEPRYIKQATTWLNQGCWDVQTAVAQAGAANDGIVYS